MCATLLTFPELKSSYNFFEENNNLLSMRFPQKLWKIINGCDSGAIRWGSSGKTVLIDYKKFQAEYLNSMYPVFKTKNITSFIRQLNLYGFRKVTSHNRDPVWNSSYTDIHEFIHEGFQHGRLDMLSQVSRKACGSKPKINDNILNLNRFSIDVGKLGKNSPIMFKRKPKSTLLMCRYALKEAIEKASYQSSNDKCREVEDPLADIVNSNSTDAVSELFGFDFNAIPNAEASMEWINKNSSLLSIDYNESEEKSFQHLHKPQCLGRRVNESIFTTCITPLTCLEGNPISQSFDENQITVKMEPDVKKQIKERNVVINPQNDKIMKIYHSEMVKSNNSNPKSSLINQRNLCLTLFPNKTCIHMPVMATEFQDNFYLQLTKAYRLF